MLYNDTFIMLKNNAPVAQLEEAMGLSPIYVRVRISPGVPYYSPVV